MEKSHSYVAKLPVSRRKFLLLGAAVASPLIARPAAPAWAQSGFPNRPIRLIIPWTAGSTADLQMRSLAQLAQAKPSLSRTGRARVAPCTRLGSRRGDRTAIRSGKCMWA